MLVIDNYDSFTYNLVQLFSYFDIEIEVHRNDLVTVEDVKSMKPDWICISPGPKTPSDAGISKDVVMHFYRDMPILGVCLGMQAINEVFGGKTVEAPLPVHGKCSSISHCGEGILRSLPSPFRAARYHSLQAAVTSCELKPLAHSPDGVVMALQHVRFPTFGIQFHLESFMTQNGSVIARNFLGSNQKFLHSGGVRDI